MGRSSDASHGRSKPMSDGSDDNVDVTPSRMSGSGALFCFMERLMM
ncbi:hypothetical protein BQ8420_04920 [Nocardiopsis sp. JB363]|nr:hypothetical protein BQ8420_04920 [Nocardiopsis sp. JB363]